MTQIATCGHEIFELNDTTCWKMPTTGEGERSYSWGIVCLQCLSEMEEMGLVLHDENEIRAWLDGKLEEPEEWW